MLSIRNNMTELERLAAERDTAVDCYRDAVHNVANYAVELDEQITSQHRRHVMPSRKACPQPPSRCAKPAPRCGRCCAITGPKRPST